MHQGNQSTMQISRSDSCAFYQRGYITKDTLMIDSITDHGDVGGALSVSADQGQ